jgi:hypothetical protein
MRILTEFDSAVKLVTDYGDPEEVKNTLDYIFALSHQCYILLAKKGRSELCKLEFTKTSPLLKPYITQKLTRRIHGEKRKALLKTLKTKQWRIMQCVLKPFKSSAGNLLFDTFLTSLTIPDGAYVFTLTDAQLLRSDGTLPWHMVSKDPNPFQGPFLPIFATSGQKGYVDIPIPNEDDLSLARNPPKYTAVPWEEKKPIAIFRAMKATGCGLTPKTNMRLKLAMMRSPLLDVGIVDTKLTNMKFDPEDGLGFLETSLKKVPEVPVFGGQDTFKYIIHVDGNVNAYRLLSTMTTGSLILRVMSPYTSWVDHMIKHKVHYIPIKEDLSDLLHVINWCKNNDDECRKIAQNGLDFARSILTRDFIQKYMQSILWSLCEKNQPPMDLEKESVKLDSTSNSLSSSKEEYRASDFSEDYIDFPSDKKRCPRGYSAKIHRNKKVCKKNKTRKAK